MDTVIIGNVQQTSSDAAYLARHVALKSGMKLETPALNLNRLCGSGFQSCVNVAQEILLGEAAIGVAGGTESMSQAPLSVYGHEVTNHNTPLFFFIFFIFFISFFSSSLLKLITR